MLESRRASGPTLGDPRRRAAVAAGLVVAVAAGVTVLLVAADRRQAHIHDELVAVFADTSYSEIIEVIQGDPEDSDRPNSDATFWDSEQVFGAISVRADGSRYTDDTVEVRWPADSPGFRRCVYVAWTRTGVSVRDRSGSACTDFID